MKRCCAEPRLTCWPLSVNERAASLRLSSPVAKEATVLIAPAWPYATGPRHIGHVVGFAVPGDVLARFWRLRGARVLMASGTDEHGTPITYEADKSGIPPKEFADRNNALIVDDLARLGMTYDIFTRTTTANHYRVTQELFLSSTKTVTWSRRSRWAHSTR